MARFAQIVVAENESLIAIVLKSLLDRWGYQVPAVARSLSKIKNIVNEKSPDLVIIDDELSTNGECKEIAQQINSVNKIPVILLTSWLDNGRGQGQDSFKSLYYIFKPFDQKELKLKIKAALASSY